MKTKIKEHFVSFENQEKESGLTYSLGKPISVPKHTLSILFSIDDFQETEPISGFDNEITAEDWLKMQMISVIQYCGEGPNGGSKILISMKEINNLTYSLNQVEYTAAGFVDFQLNHFRKSQFKSISTDILCLNQAKLTDFGEPIFFTLQWNPETFKFETLTFEQDPLISGPCPQQKRKAIRKVKNEYYKMIMSQNASISIRMYQISIRNGRMILLK